MGMTDKVNYEQEFKNFELANFILKPDGQRVTQIEFAEMIHVSSQTLSIRFKEEREKAENQEIVNNLKALARRGTNKVLKSLNSLKIESTKDARDIATIAYGAADRIGFAPNQFQVNVNQQVAIAPLFEGVGQMDLQSLIGGNDGVKADAAYPDET